MTRAGLTPLASMSIRVPIEARTERVFPGPLGGSIVNDSFESELLRDNPWADPSTRDLPVYLPPSGHSEGLPLLVLLSGYTGSGWSHFLRPPYMRSTIVRRLDRLIRTGATDEAVLVAPDCVTTLGGSQYLNSTATGPYEDYVVKEIVPWIQEKYRTGPAAVLGTSSGGYGAMVLAMRHPELFRAAGSNAGDAYFEYTYAVEFPKVVRAIRTAGGPEALLRQVLSTPVNGFGPTHPMIQALETMAYASCYSPVENAPGCFDLPMDLESGALRPDVWSKWLAWDPVRMVQTPRYAEAARRLAYLYVDGGTRDEYGLDIGARAFAAAARAQGAKVDHEEFDGVHWDSGPRYDVMIPRILTALRGGDPLVKPAPV